MRTVDVSITLGQAKVGKAAPRDIPDRITDRVVAKPEAKSGRVTNQGSSASQMARRFAPFSPVHSGVSLPVSATPL
ncbi:hypothetical protein [Amycolatopsis circi]|uniref:hypothetical protein n=1 Tax=Amycolatopsis circi TaxID=871959 RepID=UPI0013BE9850|nr:hypothetical protein [Amycolatopsis circi]